MSTQNNRKIFVPGKRNLKIFLLKNPRHGLPFFQPLNGSSKKLIQITNRNNYPEQLYGTLTTKYGSLAIGPTLLTLESIEPAEKTFPVAKRLACHAAGKVPNQPSRED
ncbi:MAG: hypothetical protein P8X95_05810 [Anaerolineales bacterium]|jgi:hypothetical protein